MKYVASGYTTHGVQFTDITKEEFQRVVAARDACLVALGLEEKFDLVLDNFCEFEVEMLRLAEVHLVWGVVEYGDVMGDRLLLDRRIVNLLTASRLYLDHSAHSLSGLFGNESFEVAEVEKKKNELYDSVFGYRLMEALRNHVQHRDLPVHIIGFENKRVEGRNVDCTEVTIVPRLDVRTLIEDGEFKKTVLEEVKKMGEEIDLRLAIREYVASLLALYKKVREIASPRLAREMQAYLEAIEKFSVLNGKKVDTPRLAIESDGHVLLEDVWLGRTFVDHWKHLEKKNSRVRDVRSLFASNNAQERK
jgi:hypothetical protein